MDEQTVELTVLHLAAYLVVWMVWTLVVQRDEKMVGETVEWLELKMADVKADEMVRWLAGSTVYEMVERWVAGMGEMTVGLWVFQ